MSIITPATVISIQYKHPYAKYNYLCVTDSSIVSLICLSNGRLWLIVHQRFSIFSHIPGMSVTTPVIYHGRYLGHCVYICSTHMDTMRLFLLLIVVYINLVDLNNYAYKCTFIAFHYNKWIVHVFVFGYNVSASCPMNCFKLLPIWRKKCISESMLLGLSFYFHMI